MENDKNLGGLQNGSLDSRIDSLLLSLDPIKAAKGGRDIPLSGASAPKSEDFLNAVLDVQSPAGESGMSGGASAQRSEAASEALHGEETPPASVSPSPDSAVSRGAASEEPVESPLDKTVSEKKTSQLKDGAETPFATNKSVKKHRGEDDFKLPPYIGPQAVKRSSSKKNKKKKKKNTKGRGGLIALIVALVVLGAAVFRFFSTVRFIIDISRENYIAAQSEYVGNIRDDSLQSKAADKFLELYLPKVVSKYSDGSITYDNARMLFDSLAGYTSLETLLASVSDDLEAQYASDAAYAAGSAAMNNADYPSAIEQLVQVGESNKNYAAAQTALESARGFYRIDALALINAYHGAGEVTNLFKTYAVARELLPGDAEIESLYSQHEAEYVATVTKQAAEYLRADDYANALAVVDYCATLCPENDDALQLQTIYSQWLTPIRVLELEPTATTGPSETTSSSRAWAAGTDADSTGNTDYGFGAVYSATDSEDYWRNTYDAAGIYARLIGKFIVHSEGASASGGYAKLYIVGDGSTLFTTTIYPDSGPASVDVDISGVKELVVRIEISPSDSFTVALCDLGMYKDVEEFKATLPA